MRFASDMEEHITAFDPLVHLVLQHEGFQLVRCSLMLQTFDFLEVIGHTSTGIFGIGADASRMTQRGSGSVLSVWQYWSAWKT